MAISIGDNPAMGGPADADFGRIAFVSDLSGTPQVWTVSATGFGKTFVHLDDGPKRHL